jgi:hypothetical protein
VDFFDQNQLRKLEPIVTLNGPDGPQNTDGIFPLPGTPAFCCCEDEEILGGVVADKAIVELQNYYNWKSRGELVAKKKSKRRFLTELLCATEQS